MINVKSTNAVKYAFMALCAGLLLMATLWYLLNFNDEPAYGDTVEYQALSRTLEIDPWRTLAYPELLRQADRMSGLVDPNLALYALQTLVSVAAAFYLFETLFLFVAAETRRRLILYRIALPLVFVALPLVAHFNLTVLTDSLAMSFFISGFAALVRIFILGRASVLTIAVAAVSIFAAGFVRPERIMQFMAILLVGAVWVLARRRNRLLLLVVVLLLAVGVSTQKLNTATQDADVGRPRPTITYALFDRVLQGHFEELYDEMPLNVQAEISREDAAAWTANGHYVATLGRRLDSPSGHQVMRDAIKAALGCCGGAIVFQASVDYLEYLTTPFNYLRESLWGTDELTSWTAWTDSRMAGAHASLTYSYIKLGLTLIAASFVLFLAGWRTLWRLVAIRELLAFTLAAVLISALMYTVRTGIDFHIRYAMPIFALEVGLFLWGAVLYIERDIVSAPNGGRRKGHEHESTGRLTMPPESVRESGAE